MIAMLLFLSGVLTFIVGGLMLLIAAFTVSIWWGIFCILFPPTNVLFILLNWKNARRPLLVQAVAILMMIAAGVMIEGFFSSLRDHPFNRVKQYSWSSSAVVPNAQLSHKSIAPNKPSDPDIINPQDMDDLPVLPDENGSH